MHAAAAADRAAHPERYRLDPDAVVERVLAREGERDGIGVDDFAAGWREGLEHYLASAAEDGRLNALGARMVRETAAGRLVAGARLRAADADARATAGRTRPHAPVVIVGGWRTGTTFLYRLLAEHDALRAPLPAELGAPWRFHGIDAEARAARIERAAGAHDVLHLLNPTMAAVHDSGPRLPEECVLAMGGDLRNWGFTSTVRLDGYADWLWGQDLTPSYELLRRAYALLEGPEEDGGAAPATRFVLKAPAHTAELGPLLAAFPDATIVHLHRDVVETVASGASLFAVFRATYSDEVDRADVGRFQLAQTERWFERARAFRASPEGRTASIVDIDYADLVADPAAVVARIEEAAGLAPMGDLDGLVGRYHRDHPRHAHGRHRYAPEDFGLDPGEVRERLVPVSGG